MSPAGPDRIGFPTGCHRERIYTMKLTPQLLNQVFSNGSLPSLVYANRQSVSEGKRVRPMHSHQNLCELLICYHGTGRYNIDSESYPVAVGDLIYYNAGSYHEVLSTGDTEIGTYCFGFTDVRMSGLPGNHLLPEDSAFVRPAGSQEIFLLQLADQIVSTETASSAEDVRVQLMAAVFLITACQIPAEKSRRLSRQSSETALAAKEYIDLHFTEPLRIEEIADVVSCSPSYLAHSFKDLTGYAPLQYMLRCRIGQAETLLISSDYTAAHIGSIVGFDSPAYFHRVFRSIAGVTPLQYRKRYLAELKGSRTQL